VSDGFVPFARYAGLHMPACTPEIPVPSEPAPPCDKTQASHDDAPELADLVAEIRRFRARLAEASDLLQERLARELAWAVLGRELMLGPCEMQSLVESALERIAPQRPLEVRLHPDDAQRCAIDGLAVIADEQVRRGDALLMLHTGTLDAGLGVRLDALLRAWART